MVPAKLSPKPMVPKLPLPPLTNEIEVPSSTRTPTDGFSHDAAPHTHTACRSRARRSAAEKVPVRGSIARYAPTPYAGIGTSRGVPAGGFMSAQSSRGIHRKPSGDAASRSTRPGRMGAQSS
jgi:hypothetical protein